jgi:hypothetical protein
MKIKNLAKKFFNLLKYFSPTFIAFSNDFVISSIVFIDELQLVVL